MPLRATEPGHSAAILFFTGVRYYRMEESASPIAAAQPSPRDRERFAPPPRLQV